MRVRSAGIRDEGPAVRISYEGRPVEARQGDTLASALTDSGDRACRTTRLGDPRGVFCGMGVCNECTLVVDGEPSTLACMTPVREGMDVRLQPPARLLEATPRPELPEQELTPDVLVLGGGPAGLAAATAAARCGLDVVLLDERGKLGGQYYKQPSEQFALDEERLDTQYRQGRALVRRAEQAGVTVLKGVRVWAAFRPDHLLAAGTQSRWTLRPRRLVLATGAYERGVPMPGWTLPGVLTTGAAQTLLRGNQVSPGTRVLVSGNGPLNMQVAAELVRAGVRVVALAELADLRRVSGARAGLTMLRSAPDLVRDGAGYAAQLARARVPVLSRTAVVRVDGDEAVQRATVARIDAQGRPVPGTERSFEVDAVCVGFGFLPSNEIARSLGCRHSHDEALGSLTVEHTPDGRTSVDGVWVVGDSAGVAGARVAGAVGVLAGAAVAADLGRPLPPGLAREVQAADRLRRRNLRFQTALARVYAAPLLVDQLAEPETVVCRCESLSLRDISADLGASTGSAGALKRVTRAGMGKCQGRYCAPVVTALVARRSGRPVDEFAGFAPQVPYKPTEISLVADPAQP